MVQMLKQATFTDCSSWLSRMLIGREVVVRHSGGAKWVGMVANRTFLSANSIINNLANYGFQGMPQQYLQSIFHSKWICIQRRAQLIKAVLHQGKSIVYITKKLRINYTAARMIIQEQRKKQLSQTTPTEASADHSRQETHLQNSQQMFSYNVGEQQGRDAIGVGWSNAVCAYPILYQSEVENMVWWWWMSSGDVFANDVYMLRGSVLCIFE